ncbi:MAG: hypothetical protein WAQ53_02055 [Thiofilum sp.]|uniref:hypothetical protein n=1 Tax=Thiofilum sp. TaxID=2212733 RepID=UPI0025DB9CC7|nr:hypothetical protein [Thiofilum sp.]MBK8453030.1 hypothetical protein [Thiofilum sp.]
MTTEQDESALAQKKATALLVLHYLQQEAQWADIYPFILSRGYQKVANPEELQMKRALTDHDTCIMAMLIYLHYSLAKETHTVSSLAKAMDNSSLNARKARERKILRALKMIAGYQLIDFYRDTHQGERTCIRIEANDLLIEFLENHFFKRKE